MRHSIPMATKRHAPMLGMYKTLSAKTKPTGKSKFEAGRNGRTSRDSENSTSCSLGHVVDLEPGSLAKRMTFFVLAFL